MTNLDRPDGLSIAPSGANILQGFTAVMAPSGSYASSDTVYVGHLTQLAIYYTWDGGNPTQMQPTWMGKNGTDLFSFGSIQHANVQGPTGAQDHWMILPIMAPYFRVDVTNFNAGASSQLIAIFGMISTGSNSAVLPCQTILDEQGVGIPANGQGNYTPAWSTPGRHHFYYQLSSAPSNMVLERWNGNNWDAIDAQSGVAATTPFRDDFNVPADDWRVSIGNTSATVAGSLYLAVTGPS